MRVAVDGRELIGRPTGVGRYLHELLRIWSRLDGPERFTVYLPGVRPGDGWTPAANGRVAVVDVPGAGGTGWEQRALAQALRRDGPDVFFAPAYTAPLATAVPFVLTVHDVSFAAHPEWFGWREGLRRRWLTRASARRAHTVLTDTDFSRVEIVERLGIPPARVRVVRPGVTPGRDPITPASNRPPMILYVGSIFERRRIPDLIRGFGRLAARHPAARLVVVGENRTTPREDFAALADRHAAGRVRFEAYVPEGRLASLYAEAAAFAFLSEYEGFGFTPLEALAAGVPVVVLDTPVAHEVYRDAALYVRPDDPDGVADALEAVLSDAATRARILDAAARLLPRYDWAAAAAETLAVLREAASGRT